MPLNRFASLSFENVIISFDLDLFFFIILSLSFQICVPLKLLPSIMQGFFPSHYISTIWSIELHPFIFFPNLIFPLPLSLVFYRFFGIISPIGLPPSKTYNPVIPFMDPKHPLSAGFPFKWSKFKYLHCLLINTRFHMSFIKKISDTILEQIFLRINGEFKLTSYQSTIY